MRQARAKGLRAGLLRPITVWPFPSDRVKKLARRVRGFVVAEVNFGQLVYEVDRCVRNLARTELAPLRGGEIHTPEQIVKRLVEVAR